MKRFFLVLSALVFAFLAQAQSLYIGSEYLNAVKNGTRTMTGMPGKNYWTNHSDYAIEADFNPKTGYIKGSESVTYYNNSPDTLKILVIRLYQDIWKKGNVRDFNAPESDLNEGTLLKKVVIDGKQYTEADIKRYNTLAFIPLKKPILPHSKATVDIDWECQIQLNRPIRYGKYDDRTFFVGYWYPEIAVYDDVYGWDKRNFTGIQEFHNDHNNFDVKIRVMFPNLVWAPGHLTNASKIYDKHIVKRIEQAKQSDDVVHIITPQDLQGDLLKQLGVIEWHYVAKNIEEFPFATSDHYVWDGTSLDLGNRRVFISAVYNPEHKTFDYMARMVKDILREYSFDIPGIPYPYEAMTIFNGGGAMEYPMMVNLSEFEDTCSNYYVTAHETGHTYFPFLTGTNETMYAWMDEGLINYFPRYVAQKLRPECNQYFKQMVERYMVYAGTSHDLPIMVPSSDVGMWDHYRHIAYNKPAFAFYELTSYLGDSLFFAALREFANRWAYKHPYPWDFFFTFNDVTGQNLNWFWKPYFFEFAKPDLAIKKAGYTGNGFDVTVENKGGLPLGFVVEVKQENGKSIRQTYKANVWKDTQIFTATFDLQAKPIEVNIYPDFNADIDTTNNKIAIF